MIQEYTQQDITFCISKDCPKKKDCHRSVETGLRKRIYSATDFSLVCHEENNYEHFVPQYYEVED